MGDTGGRRTAARRLLTAALTAALPALTRTLALEVAPVRVNLIAAGFVDTPSSAFLLGDHIDKRREQLRATLPIGRVVGPADVAALAVHLMMNTAITGATFDIDGGPQLIEGQSWRTVTNATPSSPAATVGHVSVADVTTTRVASSKTAALRAE
jgi:enoyl-[acyl-carrier-protein] reductase (NADH)